MMEPNTARVLSNYLARDVVKESLLLNGFLHASMIDKAVFLMIPAYHATLEAVMGGGIQALRGGLTAGREIGHLLSGQVPFDGDKFMGAVGDVISAPLAGPLAAFGSGPSGNKVKLYLSDPEHFAQNVGKDWLAKYPGFTEEVENAYKAGSRMSMGEDFRAGYFAQMHDAWIKENPAGALAAWGYRRSTSDHASDRRSRFRQHPQDEVGDVHEGSRLRDAESGRSAGLGTAGSYDSAT